MEGFNVVEQISGTEPGNLIFERDTQSSRKKLHWAREDFFLDFRFQRCPPRPTIGNDITLI